MATGKYPQACPEFAAPAHDEAPLVCLRDLVKTSLGLIRCPIRLQAHLLALLPRPARSDQNTVGDDSTRVPGESPASARGSSRQRCLEQPRRVGCLGGKPPAASPPGPTGLQNRREQSVMVPAPHHSYTTTQDQPKSLEPKIAAEREEPTKQINNVHVSLRP